VTWCTHWRMCIIIQLLFISISIFNYLLIHQACWHTTMLHNKRIRGYSGNFGRFSEVSTLTLHTEVKYRPLYARLSFPSNRYFQKAFESIIFIGYCKLQHKIQIIHWRVEAGIFGQRAFNFGRWDFNFGRMINEEITLKNKHSMRKQMLNMCIFSFHLGWHDISEEFKQHPPPFPPSICIYPKQNIQPLSRFSLSDGLIVYLI
jgi:hypothetical protein